MGFAHRRRGVALFNHIHHLTYGRLVFKSIGYIENPHGYRYEIRANLGDFYKVNGGNNRLATLDFPVEYGKLRSDKLKISYESEYIHEYSDDLMKGITLINQGWKISV